MTFSERVFCGQLQIVFSPDIGPEVCSQAQYLHPEYCIAVRGRITKRLAGKENPHIETGTIELMVTELTVLSESEALPFSVSEKSMLAGAAPSAGIGQVSEDLRLQYRYLDMRRQFMRDNLVLRHRIFKCIRDFLDQKGFLEIETPMLTASTPEGARDYLVPSRVHPQNFYALPQSPQLFKQLLKKRFAVADGDVLIMVADPSYEQFAGTLFANVTGQPALYLPPATGSEAAGCQLAGARRSDPMLLSLGEHILNLRQGGKR